MIFLIFYTLENEAVYFVFNEVIYFMAKHRLKPSRELQEEYKQASINNMAFPEFETLNKSLWMYEKTYDDMMKQ